MTSAGALSQSEAVAPVTAQERSQSLDVLRGAAVLGILLMNIVSFGLALHGGWNPLETTINGGSTRANLAYWFTSQVFFEGKMRCLFSLLFGAGAALLIARGDERGGGLRVADIYYRRTLWLLLFGVIHGYCVWSGDILYSYAVFGLMLFPFRQAKPKWLLLAAATLFLLGAARGLWPIYDDYQLRSRARAAASLAAEGKPLTEEQKADRKKWEEKEKRFKPDQERIKKDVEAHRRRHAHRHGLAARRCAHRRAFQSLLLKADAVRLWRWRQRQRADGLVSAQNQLQSGRCCSSSARFGCGIFGMARWNGSGVR
jgi:uncharacterized protein